jgi:hypothetical protein
LLVISRTVASVAALRADATPAKPPLYPQIGAAARENRAAVYSTRVTASAGFYDRFMKQFDIQTPDLFTFLQRKTTDIVHS